MGGFCDSSAERDVITVLLHRRLEAMQNSIVRAMEAPAEGTPLTNDSGEMSLVPELASMTVLEISDVATRRLTSPRLALYLVLTLAVTLTLTLTLNASPNANSTTDVLLVAKAKGCAQ